MKIELTSDELKEALLPYLETFFTKPIKDVYDLDVGCISMEVEFGSEEDEEPEQDKPVKRRRTRKKEVQADLVEEIEKQESEQEEVGTHYANLPKLNQEDQSKYVELLSLLSNNARNKNRLSIEELVRTGSSDLVQVIEANEHYQDWLKYCEEQDIQQAQKEMMESEPEQTEEVQSEEDGPKTEMELMKEVMEEIPDEPKEEPVKEHKFLFTSNPDVAKSGSLFPSQPSKRVF